MKEYPFGDRQRESFENGNGLEASYPAGNTRKGNLHHHDSKTLSFQASLSWCRTLAPDHLLPSSSSSTSTATHSSPPFNRDQYVAFHEMCGQAGAGPVNLALGTPVKPSSIVVFGAT